MLRSLSPKKKDCSDRTCSRENQDKCLRRDARQASADCFDAEFRLGFSHHSECDTATIWQDGSFRLFYFWRFGFCVRGGCSRLFARDVVLVMCFQVVGR